MCHQAKVTGEGVRTAGCGGAQQWRPRDGAGASLSPGQLNERPTGDGGAPLRWYHMVGKRVRQAPRPYGRRRDQLRRREQEEEPPRQLKQREREQLGGLATRQGGGGGGAAGGGGSRRHCVVLAREPKSIRLRFKFSKLIPLCKI
jgi:hypothetical protein